MAQAPRYQQVADALRRRIRSAEFAPDKPLPTEAELQDQYGVSRNTVREAVRLLEQQRLLVIRPGLGTFVAGEIVPFVTTLSVDPVNGEGEEGATCPARAYGRGPGAQAMPPEVMVIKCPADIAALMRISEADRVVSRYQERYVDGAIWSLQTSYYPREWVTKGADRLLDPEDIPEGAIKYLATFGLKQVGYRDLISARLPTDSEQVRFSLRHSHMVIEVFRTSFAEDGTPIRVTATIFPADRNRIGYDIGKVPAYGQEPVSP
jgi:GntR family transcriptional regulator